MKSKIIYKSSVASHRLIIIFAGWSTTPGFYADLHAEGWDIALVWDYSDLALDYDFINDYSSIFIVAWSLGVAAAAHVAANFDFADRVSAAFAVNGTLLPSDNSFGIPVDIYENTRRTLNARNLLKFTKRMGYNPADRSTSEKDDIEIPDFEKLALELENIRDRTSRGSLPWLRSYISSEDRIFPPFNMESFWTQHPSRPMIINLEAPHYVHLQSIIDEITPNIGMIGRRFHRALPTYDAHASAQHSIVGNLISLLPEGKIKANPSVLEIGSGSGLLSRALGEKLHPASATFIDLYPTDKFQIATEETYIVGDAEEWMASQSDKLKFDVIASASTIQWFADPRNFFRNAVRMLKAGGVLLISSFLPGNLSELDTKRPSPLLYRSEEELRGMLSPYFDFIHISSQPITLTFKSHRDLLRHLKLTGVGGGKTSAVLTSSPSPAHDSNSSHTLTYRPVYILAYNL